MPEQKTSRAIWGVCAILAFVVLARIGLLAVQTHGHGLPVRSVIVTRVVAGAFLLCDMAISASLITLLATHERRAPTWAERRLPFRGRWLWHLLLGVTILSYLSLAPTFLFFYMQLRR